MAGIHERSASRLRRVACLFAGLAVLRRFPHWCFRSGLPARAQHLEPICRTEDWRPRGSSESAAWGLSSFRAPQRSGSPLALAAVATATAATLAAVAAYRARTFLTRKENCLRKPDKSPKGSVDERVLDLCEEIQSHDELFTTSSCSGRCFLWKGRHHGGSSAPVLEDPGPAGTSAAAGIQVDNEPIEGMGNFLRFRVSHDLVENPERLNPVGSPGEDGIVWLSFQAFILHVCCRDAKAAFRLMRIARMTFDSGTVRLHTWKEGRWMIDIERMDQLEFPLTNPAGQPLLSGHEPWLRDVVNDKLERNWVGIDKFFADMQRYWDAPLLPSSTPVPLTADASVTWLAGASAVDVGLRRLQEVCAEIDGLPGLTTVSARPARIFICAGPVEVEPTDEDIGPAGSARLWRLSHDLVEASYFDLGGLPAEADADDPDAQYWLRLEPLLLRVRCSDLAAADALVAAAGTLFRRPGLRELPAGAPASGTGDALEGPFVLELVGIERVEVPLRVPGGLCPFAGQEGWLKEMVNTDLQATWNKLDRFVTALRSGPAADGGASVEAA
mmetsp:Transcript_13814/g.48790  ORF Transcript_13814/g.48790 Transcript_13814/m.48790 type:complete len:557 (-) Transcript_13814:24-1694(-)